MLRSRGLTLPGGCGRDRREYRFIAGVNVIILWYSIERPRDRENIAPGLSSLMHSSTSTRTMKSSLSWPFPSHPPKAWSQVPSPKSVAHCTVQCSPLKYNTALFTWSGLERKREEKQNKMECSKSAARGLVQGRDRQGCHTFAVRPVPVDSKPSG